MDSRARGNKTRELHGREKYVQATGDWVLARDLLVLVGSRGEILSNPTHQLIGPIVVRAPAGSNPVEPRASYSLVGNNHFISNRCFEVYFDVLYQLCLTTNYDNF